MGLRRAISKRANTRIFRTIMVVLLVLSTLTPIIMLTIGLLLQIIKINMLLMKEMSIKISLLRRNACNMIPMVSSMILKKAMKRIPKTKIPNPKLRLLQLGTSISLQISLPSQLRKLNSLKNNKPKCHNSPKRSSKTWLQNSTSSRH